MEINIDYNGNDPIYIQIVNGIKEGIRKGEIKQGDKLNSETYYSKKYYISRNTVRKALEILEKEGIIKKVKGKGSFVLSPKIYQNRSKLSKFYDDMRVLGLTPNSKILSSKKEIPDISVREKMKLKNGEYVYSVTWIRYGSEEPLIYETVHLNYKFVDGIEKLSLDSIKLYDILEKKFGIKPENGKEWFYPCRLSESEMKYLKVKTGDVGMHVERIMFYGKEVLEYTESVVRGDRFIYTIDFYNEE
ncbi:MAG: GntR family transcriptional regulator [Leptotrichiaceae bacterium]|nr:GntR family transcriptional regulator [Leptotrichiaceae bacterium]